MLTLGSLAFLSPWLLLALAALPALWWLLRATPPSPRMLRFPGVGLLLGLEESERMPDKTPWWLLLLRVLAVAAAILAFARPVLNPVQGLTGGGPVLILMDGGWASAPDWEQRRARALEALEQAGRAGRPVIFHALADPAATPDRLRPRPAEDWQGAIDTAVPLPWAPDRAGFARLLPRLLPEGEAETLWLTDGLAHGEGDDPLGPVLADLGPLTMVTPARSAVGLRPLTLQDGLLETVAIRSAADAAAETPRPVAVAAIGRGPQGTERRLALAEAEFAPGETEVPLSFELPLELRNQVERAVLTTGVSAGGATLADDAVRRKRVGLVAGEEQENRPLTSQLHYLRQALVPSAETSEGSVSELLEAGPDALVLADVGAFSDDERTALTEWVEAGGLLVRFAGPRVARAAQEFGAGDDPLLPVRLRAGGRAVGGAMSWGAPQAIRDFPDDGPFAGLTPPAEVTISRQVLAQPGPDLPDRTLAALEDGTPLVTAATLGEGRVVFFHVTANAEWSSLPLSGLFVQMLERLAIAASSGGADAARELAGATWTPVAVLDGFGRLGDPQRVAGVDGATLAEGASPGAPPGVWQAEEQTVAVNLIAPERTLNPLAPAPGASVESFGRAAERDFRGPLLALAMLLLAADAVAALLVSGRLRLPRAGAAAAVALVALSLAPGAAQAQAVDEDVALRATSETVLAHVLTGDAEVDRIAQAGLRGLSRVLNARTAVEPTEPVGVDLERDVIAFYPLLYWPVTPAAPSPSADAVEKLNDFMRTGGMIVFDTRDAHLASGLGAGTPEGRALRRLAEGLDLPPLEQAPQDHVLTRTFYLLRDFPGRWTGGETWLEAADEAEEVEGMPFRNLNDGVTPVIIGANDWAAAWAVSEAGDFLQPVGRDGGRQREMAFRFGVNLVMYALTGSYKSDQVHVPALLERLEN